ncbi:Uncharacterised protein [Mycobacteroides abscessus subsp. massiliense]|nr:Uncharacterised protein [Mycobacteroides abscessus subsp. massiliense]
MLCQAAAQSGLAATDGAFDNNITRIHSNFSHTAMLAQFKIRKDFGQRQHNETALMRARMRQSQMRVIAADTVKIDDVQIQGARCITESTFAPKFGLYAV